MATAEQPTKKIPAGSKSLVENHLYYGDNLEVLKLHVKDESVDLVYLDPPFNSARNYNVLFEEKDGSKSASQIKAFDDTWRWDQGAALAYEEVVLAGGRVSDVMRAFRTFLGETDMLAYLAMMAPRLVELRRVLKPTGSLYLHCDPTASHYLKLLLDAVFGPDKFVSEIIWKRATPHNDAKRWSPVHDSILYYSRGDSLTWNPQYDAHSEAYLDSKYRHKDPDGRIFRLDNMTSPNPRPNMTYEWKGHASPANGWRYSRETMANLDADGRIWYPDVKSKRPQLKRYLDEMPGSVMTDVWTDISPINSQAQERLGYPTQKPQVLLERIIAASSNKGDVVLDPFCGCGTTIEAALSLGRTWIGIDVTHLAITLIKNRIQDAYEGKAAYTVIGEPTSIADAEELAATDKYQFQWWALGLVGARPLDQKKGADKGIDGQLLFHGGASPGDIHRAIFSVKAGHLKAGEVRDLVGTVQREGAQIGVLISFEQPTKQMRAEAASHGFYHSLWGNHPKIQLITVGELLDGKTVDMPRTSGINKTFKAAPKATGPKEVKAPKKRVPAKKTDQHDLL